MEKVAIIIVNYKDYAEKFLADCRDSLRAQDYSRDLWQAYIVDNASSKDSRIYLGEKFPEAIIIPRTDGNYAAANNSGIRQARRDGFKYFVIANLDVKFARDWLRELMAGLMSGSGVGAAQAKVLLYRGDKSEIKEKKINSLGNIINFLGFGFTRGYMEPDREIKGYPEIKGYGSGCSLALKAEVLDKIGGYNEELYMYHDDLDLGWKIRLAGYRTVLAPKSVVYHKYSFARSVNMIYYMERNRYLVVFSYYRCLTILLILPALIAMDIGMFVFSIINKWFLSNLRVYGYFFRPGSWIKIFKVRREVRKMRKVSDREIVKDFSGKVLFQEIDNPVLKYIANPVFNFYWQVVKRIIWW